MGYTTDFWGCVFFTPPLPHHAAFLLKGISQCRRTQRDVRALGLNYSKYGTDGEFFVPPKKAFWQNSDLSVGEYNCHPSSQHSLNMDWLYDEELGTLEWNGTEKFYGYTDWLSYIIANFAIPNGCEVNGRIAFQGEDDADCGVLIVTRNVVTSESIDPSHFGDARAFCISLKEQGLQAHIKPMPTLLSLCTKAIIKVQVSEQSLNPLPFDLKLRIWQQIVRDEVVNFPFENLFDDSWEELDLSLLDGTPIFGWIQKKEKVAPVVGDSFLSQLATKCVSMKKLSLSFCTGVTHSGLSAIANLKDLTHLDLSMLKQSIVDEAISHIVVGCSKLRKLNLAGGINLSSDGLKTIAEHLNQTLVCFILTANAIVDDESVSYLLNRCRALKKLNLFACARVSAAAFIVGHGDEKDQREQQHIGRLKHLELSYTDVRTNIFEFLHNRFPTLQKLGISRYLLLPAETCGGGSNRFPFEPEGHSIFVACENQLTTLLPELRTLLTYSLRPFSAWHPVVKASDEKDRQRVVEERSKRFAAHLDIRAPVAYWKLSRF